MEQLWVGEASSDLRKKIDDRASCVEAVSLEDQRQPLAVFEIKFLGDTARPPDHQPTPYNSVERTPLVELGRHATGRLPSHRKTMFFCGIGFTTESQQVERGSPLLSRKTEVGVGLGDLCLRNMLREPAFVRFAPNLQREKNSSPLLWSSSSEEEHQLER